ncbi:MAG: box helicase protein [Candidatus Cloacimonadota bacterium]|nr:box helicase protein [Candidatus Cloacimonadota bacterium]
MNPVEELIERLQSDKRHRNTIVSTWIVEAKEAERTDFPAALNPILTEILNTQGISGLYTHQAEAIEYILQQQNVVISSQVASGKSLCYQLPILNAIIDNPEARALLIYPTKALAQDQAQKMAALSSAIRAQTGRKIKSAVYDGDTPSAARSQIRRQANIVFSNPDMLHLGILPNHSLWVNFLAQLRYVVIDEIHYYRGVFGSHFANVLRRLSRLCRLYRSRPVFICTSATLANHRELAEALAEVDFKLIDQDGSPNGKRINMIINPPLVDAELGIRRSSMMETNTLAHLALSYPLQSILFSLTRRSVEMLLLHMPNQYRHSIASYRSGYLATKRREIEKDLREGKLKLIISTNALELGIDIGGLDLALINAYPGSISAVRQESGRAGRKANTAAALLVAGSSPLDQYICRHPEYLWENNPEQALIDPNNTEILQKQLLCAISELSLREGESFGKMDFTELSGYLQILLDEGKIRKVGDKYMGIMGAYPAAEVSLRNASNQLPILAEGECIGYVDQASAFWMTHPNAIYLHQAETWIVKQLDLQKELVLLEPITANYYTQALRETDLILKHLNLVHSFAWGKKYFGQVKVVSQVTGFKKIRFGTLEILGVEELDLPTQELDTVAWWISLSGQVVEKIRQKGLWNSDPNDYGKDWNRIAKEVRKRDGYRCVNCQAHEEDRAWDVHHKIPLRSFKSLEEANDPRNLITLCPRCHHLAEQQVHIQSGLSGLAYLLHHLASFFVMCDPSNLGVSFEPESELTQGDPMIALYDMIPGGIGLCRKLYEIQDQLFNAALEQISTCPCESGCPACVGPVAERGEGAKAHAQAILEELILSRT